MKIQDFIAKESVIITDGPMETRIAYNTSIAMDPDGSIFRLIYTPNERDILAGFYRQDLDIAQHYQQAILLNAPTFRASAMNTLIFHIKS